MQPKSFPSNAILAGALAALVSACAGCAARPVGSVASPVFTWSPFRFHPLKHPGEPAGVFGHFGTCWSPWPAGWLPCPEQQCDVVIPQPDEGVQPPLTSLDVEAPVTEGIDRPAEAPSDEAAPMLPSPLRASPLEEPPPPPNNDGRPAPSAAALPESAEGLIPTDSAVEFLQTSALIGQPPVNSARRPWQQHRR